ncbi:hypothetical protein [Elioraea sp.]|jgi:hypothetical protein|uniref:hypothetical protein n=2 Tax=Elioraea sp. TaxID=2185103 RepID=UPI00307D6D57
MSMRRCLSFLLAALVAAAAPAQAGRDPCPPPGTVAVRDDGARWLFLGQDEEDDGLCLVRVGEQTRRLLFGFWTPIGPDLAEARAALARLLEGGPGTTVTIREHVMSDSWQETWQRGEEEAVALASGTRRALRLERRMRLFGPTGFVAHVTYWLDADTGVVLKTQHRHIEGMRLPYRDLVMTRLDRRG